MVSIYLSICEPSCPTLSIYPKLSSTLQCPLAFSSSLAKHSLRVRGSRRYMRMPASLVAVTLLAAMIRLRANWIADASALAVARCCPARCSPALHRTRAGPHFGSGVAAPWAVRVRSDMRAEWARMDWARHGGACRSEMGDGKTGRGDAHA